MPARAAMADFERFGMTPPALKSNSNFQVSPESFQSVAQHAF
jgi:hypothetical protein